MTVGEVCKFLGGDQRTSSELVWIDMQNYEKLYFFCKLVAFTVVEFKL